MSEIKALTVPKWGMAMEEGTLVNWLVKEGDQVSPGDEVAEIESSKIVNVMETHVAGTVHRLVAKTDETLPVGGLLAVIGDKDASKEDVDEFIASFKTKPGAIPARDSEAPAQAAAEPGQEPPRDKPAAAASASSSSAVAHPQPARGGIPESLQNGGDDSGAAATPHARRLAEKHGINLTNIKGSGRHDRVTVEDIEKAVSAAGGSIAVRREDSREIRRPASLTDDSGVPATPLARRLAKQKGLNLHDCRASGSRGRVSKADVEALELQRQGGARTADAHVAGVDGQVVEEIPMSGMRQTIGRRLQQSKIEIPHYRLVADANLDALLALRRELNESLSEANISVNDLLIKCCATALMQVPDCNVQLHGDTIHRFRDADVAMAVALDAGLITPVIRCANRKGVTAISNEARELVTKARAGTLKQEEFEGGTFTVSNLGMFGLKQFDAIINPPQCAILAVGAGEERVIVKGGEPEVATVLTLSLSLDHRVIDGAVGARFMQALVRVIEHPGLMSA